MLKTLNFYDYPEPRNTAEKVYFELEKMLFNYEIVPGQKLQYQDLAEKFNVSMTPVRDALKMLEEKGYVELRHNKGYYVAEISLEEAKDLLDIRESLEILAVRRGTEKLNPKSLRALREAMDEYTADTRRPVSRKRLMLDANFHLAIAELSQNETLVEMLRLVISKIYLKHRIENLSQGRGKVARVDHKKIYDAIASRDIAAALERMREHLAGSRKNILQFLIGRK